MTTGAAIQVQGRVLCLSELEQIQRLIDQNPDWSRAHLARTLCAQWAWQTPKGIPKTFACRSLLLGLEQRHRLRLPPLRVEYRPHRPWSLGTLPTALPDPVSLALPLAHLQPLQWILARPGTPLRGRAWSYLRQHHYLGLGRPVGSHLLYLVQDRCQRDLAVHLVGAAAWQCAPRDRFIGWSAAQRAGGLQQVANHSRFLILPGVRVAHLASHLLAGLRQRLVADWHEHHGHRLALLESFVEVARFAGTAYQADNWRCLGFTQGRTRQDKSHRPVAPVRTVWVHPLRRDFRRQLQLPSTPEAA